MILDFGKYSLLNHLRKVSGAKLGVVWYLVNPDHTDREHQKNDGKYIDYLGLNGKKPDKKLLSLEPDLFCQLRSIVTKNRSIQAIESSHLLGPDTLYFSTPISNAALNNRRTHWLDSSLEKVKSAGLVFLDPDNGLASEAKNGNSVLDAKHVVRSELKRFWENSQTVIVMYRHLNRSGPHDIQIGKLTSEIQEFLIGSAVLPMRYRRGSSRAYFVIVPKKLSRYYKEWLRDFVRPWPRNSFECKFFD